MAKKGIRVTSTLQWWLVVFLFVVSWFLECASLVGASVPAQECSGESADCRIEEPKKDKCWFRFLTSLDKKDSKIVDQMSRISVVLHRNGEVEECGVSEDFLAQLRQTINSLEECPWNIVFDKYEVESLFTTIFHRTLSSCASQEPDRTPEEGFLGYCDMGTAKTPILLDHDKLVPIPGNNSNSYLPCHFHSREGVRINSFRKLAAKLAEEYQKEESQNCDQQQEEQVCSNKKQVHLYAVPAGRVFMFAPSFVGEIFELPHIVVDQKPVYLQVLSVSPRVFDIFHYFTREESASLVAKAQAETSESHRIKRSTTGGSSADVVSTRTSESGWDTHGSIAQKVKRRCFSVLGFDEYIEGHSDGLQILRYNQTRAYNAHMDWIEDDARQAHNYNSAGKGGNRFATILLYMTDLGEQDGGETVFVKAKPLGDNPKTYNQALQELRDSEQSALVKRNSWEEKMVAECRSSLAIRPNSARAVLFYSQLPNGKPDPASLHGGCPVLSSESKWAANLWVWNTPRPGFAGAPLREQRKK